MTKGKKGTGTPTVTAPHTLIAFGGVIGAPALEIWECTIKFAGATGNPQADIVALSQAQLATELAGLQTHIARWFSATDPNANGAGMSCISQSVYLDYIKLNNIDSRGYYVNTPNTLQFAAVQGPGGGDAFSRALPWNCTTVLTTRVGNRRTGRGAHGRMYPPVAGSSPLTGTPYQDPQLVAAMANNFAHLLSDINGSLFNGQGFAHAALDPGVGNCVLVSVQPHHGPNTGAAPMVSVITSVECDQVPDVMTSRVDRVKRKITAPDAVTNITNVTQ